MPDHLSRNIARLEDLVDESARLTRLIKDAVAARGLTGEIEARLTELDELFGQASMDSGRLQDLI